MKDYYDMDMDNWAYEMDDELAELETAHEAAKVMELLELAEAERSVELWANENAPVWMAKARARAGRPLARSEWEAVVAADLQEQAARDGVAAPAWTVPAPGADTVTWEEAVKAAADAVTDDDSYDDVWVDVWELDRQNPYADLWDDPQAGAVTAEQEADIWS